MSRLTAAFEARILAGAATSDSNLPVAVCSWPSLPIEIIRAAGLRPAFIRAGSEPTAAADAHLEPGVFPNRLHQLVEAAVTGALSHAACIILPRTSDSDYKCFLYLRELVRRGVARTLPPVLLFDLLQSHGADLDDYNAGRVRALLETLAAIAGRRPALDAVRQQIAAANTARAARRRLLALRHDMPRVRGVEALPLLGAFWPMPPDEYVSLATEAAAALASRPVLDGPRVLLAGAPGDGTALHAAIESHGAVVVAETSPWGTGAAGHDVDAGADPATAIAATYRADAIGPRVPVDQLRRRLLGMPEVDAVVVSLPEDDSVFGWDYPPLRDRLASRGIPHIVLRGLSHVAVTDEDHSRLASLMRSSSPREARHA